MKLTLYLTVTINFRKGFRPTEQLAREYVYQNAYLLRFFILETPLY